MSLDSMSMLGMLPSSMPTLPSKPVIAPAFSPTFTVFAVILDELAAMFWACVTSLDSEVVILVSRAVIEFLFSVSFYEFVAISV